MPHEDVHDDDAIVADARNPDAVLRALRAERETARAARAEVKELRTEVETLTGQLAEQTNARAAAESTALRYEVLTENGLALGLAARLSGTTRDELNADAKALVGSLAGLSNRDVDLDGGARVPSTRTRSPEQQHARFVAALLTPGRDPYDDD